MTVGVRSLKAELSRYLKHVESGGSLTVTDRGRPIATIVPIDRPPIPAWIRGLIAEGRVTWSGGKPLGLNPPVKSRGKLASQMVLEDRR